jgi:tetratricopeptide (TPR) repeat protein
MKKQAINFLIILSVILTSCSSEKDKLYSEIKSIEKTLFADDMGLNDSIAFEYASKCDNYAKTYRDDANSPELLFKSGEVLSGLGRYDASIRRFQDVYNIYPNYNKRAESIFICGFIFDTHLQDKENADYHYNKFIKEYPNHKLYQEAKTALLNSGKSAEELVREFEAKNKTNQ